MAYVTTGFSKPYYALYAASGGSVTYSSGGLLARGVSVAVDATTVEDNNFYADNILAESENGQVSGGTLTLTVDGLDQTARRRIFGLPAAATSGSYSGFTAYGDEATMPFCGVGFIRRTMNNGTTNYWAVIFPKVKFAFNGEDAQTSEDQISWQTTELSASFFRDDTSHHNWKYVGETAYTTEASAEAALKGLLSIT